jgi:plastocyanin
VAGVKRLLRLAGAAAAVTVVVAACSSGNDSSGSAAPSVATTSAAAPTTSAPGGREATSSDDNGGSENGPAASSGTITIKDFAFGGPLTVRPGATIKVTNMDSPAHDVASDDEGKFRTPLLNRGESATFTAPVQPGTYKFSCTVHAQMQGIGTLIVHD